MILATRFGFHGKKGLAGAVTGCETDHERDPRVRFISFPMKECDDVSRRGAAVRPGPVSPGTGSPAPAVRPQARACSSPNRISAAAARIIRRRRICNCCRHFAAKTTSSSFSMKCRRTSAAPATCSPSRPTASSRTSSCWARGWATACRSRRRSGRADLFGTLDYGEGSDTWSANPLCCAAVLATLDEFAGRDVLDAARRSSAIIEEGLVRLKELPFVAHVRGEKGGMVWGVEMRDHAGKNAADWANALVLACYRGDGNAGIHLLGPLAKKVIRIAPPLVITEDEAARRWN